MQFARGTVDRHRLDIGVAGEQEMRRDRLEELRAVLARVRPRDQVEQRMAVARLGALLHQEAQPPTFSATSFTAR